ncbi:MAG: hypothetical protein RL486_464 [Actinomycetota bacterium]|jgi:hypothetical protein
MILTTTFGPCLCKTWTCWVYETTRRCCSAQHQRELVVSRLDGNVADWLQRPLSVRDSRAPHLKDFFTTSMLPVRRYSAWE